MHDRIPQKSKALPVLPSKHRVLEGQFIISLTFRHGEHLWIPGHIILASAKVLLLGVPSSAIILSSNSQNHSGKAVEPLLVRLNNSTGLIFAVCFPDFLVQVGSVKYSLKQSTDISVVLQQIYSQRALLKRLPKATRQRSSFIGIYVGENPRRFLWMLHGVTLYPLVC